MCKQSEYRIIAQWKSHMNVAEQKKWIIMACGVHQGPVPSPICMKALSLGWVIQNPVFYNVSRNFLCHSPHYQGRQVKNMFKKAIFINAYSDTSCINVVLVIVC